MWKRKERCTYQGSLSAAIKDKEKTMTIKASLVLEKLNCSGKEKERQNGKRKYQINKKVKE